MATFQAIETISDVLVRLLQASHDPADFGTDEQSDDDRQRLQFAVYQGEDFRVDESPTVMPGVSLFLYRVQPNETMRTPPGRRRPSGQKERTQLPTDLRYLLTVWAETATMQQRIAGWVMRTLEDTPIIPRGVLHSAHPNVFAPDETVEIVLDELTNDELFRIWDVLDAPYRLSIPYLVRNVRIESSQTIPAEAPVEHRIFDFIENGSS